MAQRLRTFGAFWLDFVVGDDWVLAVAVAVALTATWVLSRTTWGSTWWIVPAVVLPVLMLSLWRKVRRTH